MHKSTHQQITLVPRQRASTHGHAPEGYARRGMPARLQMQPAKSFALPGVSVSLEKGATSPTGLPRRVPFPTLSSLWGNIFLLGMKVLSMPAQAPTVQIKLVE